MTKEPESSPTCLVTGGSGFFGRILKNFLLDQGYSCVSIDLESDDTTHPNLKIICGDIRDAGFLRRLFAEHCFREIYHCAAILAHATVDRKHLWTCNVDGTRILANIAKEFSVRHIVFISSNCLWARGFGRSVTEDDMPEPVEIYGQSKWEGEKILLGFADDFSSTIIRCPTITDQGRLGLLSILFEFISEGRRTWVLGGGENIYQFIYAEDLAAACVMATHQKYAGILNIGSDNVKSFKEVYQYVLERANTGARLAYLPKKMTILAMKIAYFLKLSPLGPYQYRMIAESFVFDTSRIKQALGWQPSLTNEEMLWKSYQYYHLNRTDIKNRKNVSAHRQAAKMGIIRILKWLS